MILSRRTDGLLVFCFLACACSEGSGDTGGVAGSGGSSGSGGSGGGDTSPSCADICPALVAEQCPDGPPSQEECVTGCEEIRSGPCETEYDALFACSGLAPNYACTAQGSVTVVGCESEFDAMWTCVVSP
jgi:hypothetical protein